MRTAEFRGIVDVPLFNGPVLPTAGRPGYGGPGQEWAHSATVPLLDYWPQRLSGATDAERRTPRRISGILPLPLGVSDATLNPTVTTSVTAMTSRLGWVNNFWHCINELENGSPTSIYRYAWFSGYQPRLAGAFNPTPSTYFSAMDFQGSRLEIAWDIYPHKVEADPFAGWPNQEGPGVMGVESSNALVDRRRVYVYSAQNGGVERGRAFTLAGEPWDLNGFCNGANPVWAHHLEDVIDTPNWLFACRGVSKSEAWIVPYRLVNPGDPFPAFEGDEVQIDDAVLQAVLAATQSVQVQAWHGGFILHLDTNGTGPTGQPYEILVCSANMREYRLLNFIPQTGEAQAALIQGAFEPSVKIDHDGTVWLHNGGSDPSYLPQVFYSWAPALFFNPVIRQVELPSVVLPCYNTCLPGQ